MKADEEMVVIVDDENRVVGAAPRSKMRKERLPHRAVYVLVFNSANELFVQKRTMSKDIYPGYYDIAAGGVVAANESYEQSAERELAEELGVSSVPLSFLFDCRYEDEDNLVWGRVFACRYDGRVILQEEEVASGRFMPFAAIQALSRRELFTPDGLVILARLVQEYGLPEERT